MVAANIQVTQGAGTRLATSSYTEGGVTVHDEKVIFGEPYLPTFASSSLNAPIGAVAGAHIFQVMAGGALNVYIRRIVVTQSALSTTAGIIALAVVRLTSAGTGGNVRPVSAFDTGDAPTSSAMTAPTVFGTEGAELWRGYCQTIQTVYTGGPDNSTVLFDLDFDRFRTKGIRIPAGTANGMAFKTLSTSSGTGVNVWVLLSEASF